MTLLAGSAIGAADKAEPELVAEVVGRALARAGASHAHTVLLFLTPHFSRGLPPALLAASRTAHCLQVAGCTAAGVFSDEDWILDRPAASALVLTGQGAAALPPGNPPRLSLATPEAVPEHWFGHGPPRVGMLSSDSAAQRAGRVWLGGKVHDDGHVDFALAGVRCAWAVSAGLRALTEPLEVSAAEGFELQRLAGQPALTTLLRELPAELRSQPAPPLHAYAAAVIAGTPERAFDEGRYALVPIISGNSDDRSITLAARLSPGEQMFWVARLPVAAEHDTQAALMRAGAALDAAPAFALVFSCIGRGPYYFDGSDRDLEALRARHAGLPFVGAYGAGEIAPAFGGVNRLLHHSAVFALYAADVQPQP